MRYLRYPWLTLVKKSVGLLIGGCSLTFNASANDRQEIVMNWMKTPQTFCIGRAATDLPPEMKATWQKYTYNGDEIFTTPHISLARFTDMLVEREKQLRDGRRMENTGTAMLETDIPWLETVRSSQPRSRLFVFRETSNRRLRVPYKTESYLWDSETLFLLRSSADSDKIEVAVADELDKINRIKARDNSLLSAEPGYCFDGGIVTGGSRFYEFSSVQFVRSSTPGGATLEIEMRPGSSSDDELFDRSPKVVEVLGDLASHTQTLRQGKRNLGELFGQEVLTKISANGITAFFFVWEAKGIPDSVLHPNTHIEMQIGGEINKQTSKREESILTEEEALALWDSVLDKFRIRPGAAK
jgi:hypothetical protein